LSVGSDIYRVITISPIGLCKPVIIHDIRGAITRAAVVFCSLFLLLSGGAGHAATPPPLRAPHAAVASDSRLASEAGVAALKAGGNAVDAACATALVLGVVEPDASGIGGGGFALVHLAKDGKTRALDFRERAPAAAAAELYLDGGKPVTERSQRGGLAVAVPGEVRGLAEMVRRWGKLPFARCVEPAAHVAAQGFPISWRLAESLRSLDPKEPTANRAFLDTFTGRSYAEGQILRRPELARTLGKLRAGGADAFYKGEIAAEIVASVRAAGGVLTAADLAGYAPTERTPLEAHHRGLRVVTMPPPSSGGVALIEALGILDAHYPAAADLDRDGRGSSAYLHAVTEALKHAFADRARYLGDPDFVTVDVAHFVDPAYQAELARRIKPNGVLPRDAYGTAGAPPAVHRDGGTTHLSVIDADGNAVALTSTVNLAFGSHVVAGKTGIVLNDQMDDFSVAPGVPNAFGLVGNAQNAIAPGKRPLSSMTPTIAFDSDGKVRVVVGAAGGPRIISATLQVLLGVTDWKLDAQAAVAAPRVHDQWVPEVLNVDADIPRDVTDALAKRGHTVKPFPTIGVVNVLIRSDQGVIEAGAEPRSASTPAGY
jgi:gamma-glutamyltranspeptidase/glutathione hydrolase